MDYRIENGKIIDIRGDGKPLPIDELVKMHRKSTRDISMEFSNDFKGFLLMLSLCDEPDMKKQFNLKRECIFNHGAYSQYKLPKIFDEKGKTFAVVCNSLINDGSLSHLNTSMIVFKGDEAYRTGLNVNEPVWTDTTRDNSM